jgi:hypothetical protein
VLKNKKMREKIGKKIVSFLMVMAIGSCGLLGVSKNKARAYSPPISRVAGISLGGGGDVSALALAGDYAIASLPSGSGGIVLINISDPIHPQQVGQLSLNSGAQSIAVSGNFAYVGTSVNSSGPEFYVINISNPSNPSISGSLELGGSVENYRAIAISGHYAYVGAASDGTGYDDPGGSANEFHVIDVANPAAPVEVGGINPDTFDKNGFSILSVAVQGDYAYVGRTTGYDSRNCFSSIDISDPVHPSIVSTLAWSGSISGYGVSIFDHYAYLGIYDAAEQIDSAIADISDPTHLGSAKTFNTGSGRVLASAATQKYVFAGGGFNYADPPFPNFMVFDVSNPSNSVMLGNLTLGANATDVEVSGNYAFVTTWANGTNGSFQVIDISAFTTADTTYPTVTMNSPGSGHLSGNITLIANASDDLRVASVQFKVDGDDIGSLVTTGDLTSPFTNIWDTSQTPDGNHTLTAVATDTSGNQTTSNGISVVVDNAGGDHVNPIVSMQLPDDGSTIANYVLAKATATDNFAISSVQFKLDGNNLGSPVTSSPYKVSWDTSTASNGNHTLTAVATDTSDNQATSAGVSVVVDNSNKWFSDFTPQHEYYVSPNGTGDGSSESNPMSLANAVAQANSGDLYWLLEGTYVNGTLDLTRSGTSEHPIVWRAFPGAHVLVNGHVEINAGYNWVWGMEVTDVGSLSSERGISLNGTGARAINNVVHDLWGGGEALGMSSVSAGQVAYGNILYGGTDTPFVQRSHLVYPQNNFDSYGYKYFVDNMFLDPPKQACNLQYDANDNVIGAQDCFAFHAYATGGIIQGMNVQKNIFANGRVLIGGFGLPADHEVMKDNYFYDTGPQFGYRRPTQAECTGNYIGNGSLNAQWWWGEGEINYTQYAPNVFRDNEVYHSDSNQTLMDVRTSAYTVNGREEGPPPFPKTDSVDNNKFSSPLKASLNANNISASVNDLPSWQAAAVSAGNQFDTSSQVVPFPTQNKVAIISNEYEAGRANVALYNWSGGPNANIDLSSVLSPGQKYYIYDAKDAFGIPRASGTYSGGTVSVQTEGSEFLSLLLTSTANYNSADINMDQKTDQTDFNILKNDFLKLAANLTNTRSDVDGDGQATIKDVGIMMSEWEP